MDRQQRFGEAFAAQRSLVDQRRQQAEAVVQSYREAGSTLGLGSRRDNVNEREEFTRLVFEQQAVRYAHGDDDEEGSSSSLSGGTNVGGFELGSESSARSVHSEPLDFSEFDDAPPLYRAGPYQHLPNYRGGLVPYDATSVESSLSSHSSGYIPPRPPRQIPPHVQSPEYVNNQRYSPAGSIHGSIAVSQRLSPETVIERQRFSPAGSIHGSVAGSQRLSPAGSIHGSHRASPVPSIQESIGSAFEQALVPSSSIAPQPTFVSTYPTNEVAQPAAKFPKPAAPKKKTLKVSAYAKTAPSKIKISRPTWPPPGDVVMHLDPTKAIVEPKAPKSKNYTPAYRNIDELIKQDNRCARLYGQLYDQDDDYECNVSAEDVPRVISWPGFAFPPALTRIITEEFRYERPRKVQTVVTPLILAGFDVICRMENAAGKTMAYILPMFTILHDRLASGDYQQNAHNDLASHPFALIIADTRELTTQIFEQICKCNLAFNYKISRCIGEFDRRLNVQELQRGADIVVGTPGRLRDVVESGYLNVNDLQYIVFDEADRIFSPGFWETLNPIFQRFPHIRQRQMSFFGATMDLTLDLGQFLRPGHATVVNLTYKIAPRLNFYFCFVNRRTRYSTFLTNYAENIIKDNPCYSSKMLIFMRTIDECNQMRDFMQQNLKTCQVLAMNSSRNQFQRDAIIKELRNPAPTDHLIVLTTNLMCRGLDIPEVNHVVHFSIDDFNDFVNRSGRTGRLCDGYVHVLIDKDASIPNVKMVRQALVSIKHDIPPEIDLFIASKFSEIDFV